MQTQGPTTISILGKGAVGTALATQCRAMNLDVSVVRLQGTPITSGSDLFKEYTLDTWLKGVSEKKPSSHWVFCTVPDDSIPDTVDRIIGGWSHVSKDPLSEGLQAIIHTSGVRTSQDFERVKQQGVAAASMHPIQTFHKPSVGTSSSQSATNHSTTNHSKSSTKDSQSLSNPFSSIHITLEGDESLLPSLIVFCEQTLQAKPIRVSQAQKQQIHAAAVLSSNFLFPNLSLASALLRDARLSSDILDPLVQSAAHKALHEGLTAISGPVARLDTQTVQRNLDALRSHPTALKRYISESEFLIHQLTELGHFEGKNEDLQNLRTVLTKESDRLSTE
jgi:predicted short-subunit dehydrogenase-like oxidoreductase (DUF2520 family)